ncbi:hypothetical protein pb186bvf_016697 [Paramecium bursaria]
MNSMKLQKSRTHLFVTKDPNKRFNNALELTSPATEEQLVTQLMARRQYTTQIEEIKKQKKNQNYYFFIQQKEAIWFTFTSQTKTIFPKIEKSNSNYIHCNLLHQLFEEEFQKIQYNQQQDTVFKEKISHIPQWDPFKTFWDIVILISLVWIAIYMPYRIAFINHLSPGLIAIESILDLIFMIDLILIFFSCYYDQCNDLIEDHRKIVLNYLTGWFLFDLISIMPITQIATFTNQEQAWFLVANKICRLFRVVKISQILKNAQFLDNQKLQWILNIVNIQTAQLLRIFVTSVILSNYFACFWYISAHLISDSDNWIEFSNIEGQPNYSYYIDSYYWAQQTLTTVGYGDFKARNNLEFLTAIVWIVIGGVFYSMVIGNLTSRLQELDSESQYKEIISQFKTLFKMSNVLDEIQKNVYNYLRYNNRENISWQLQFQNWFSYLPQYLQQEIILYTCYKKIIKVEQASHNLHFAVCLLPSLRLLKLKKGELVYLKGDPVDEIFCVLDGQVQYRTQYGKVLMDVPQGNIFGELEFFKKYKYVKQQEREYFVIAMENSILMNIQSDKYFELIEKFPDLMKILSFQAEKKRLHIYNQLNQYSRHRQRELQNSQRLEQIKSANNIDAYHHEERQKKRSIIFLDSHSRTIELLERLIQNKNKKWISLQARFHKVVNMIMFANRTIEKTIETKHNMEKSTASKSSKVSPILNIIQTRRRAHVMQNFVIKFKHKSILKKQQQTHRSLKDIFGISSQEDEKDFIIEKITLDNSIIQRLNNVHKLVDSLGSVRWMNTIAKKGLEDEIQVIQKLVQKYI